MEELWPKIANILMATNVCLVAVSFKLWLDTRRERRLRNEQRAQYEIIVDSRTAMISGLLTRLENRNTQNKED